MTHERDDEPVVEREGSPPEADAEQQDTEAILSRRAFLVRSALAGAGVAAAGCGDKPQPGPKVCLGPPPARRDAGVKPKGRPRPGPDAGPKPCLKVKPPDHKPRPCLSAPRPCLKVKPPRAQPCLQQKRLPDEDKR